MEKGPYISVIVPFFNEEHTIGELHRRLVSVLGGLGKPYEIIFIDDSSSDQTFERMRGLRPLRAFSLTHNAGQTKAFGLGFAKSRGEIIVTLDGDLENFPEDIPKLVVKIEAGADVVAGWRKHRWQGQYLTRRLPSLLANRLISWVSGYRIHDHGCFLRAYRRKFLEGFDFQGAAQRMVVSYAALQGARITEIEVGYAPRKYGVSKFGLMRTFEVLIDLLMLQFLHRFDSRPRHFFGAFGLVSLFFSGVAFLLMVYLKVFKAVPFIITPLPLVVTLFFVVGLQLMLMGILAEIIVQKRNKEMPFVFEVKDTIEA